MKIPVGLNKDRKCVIEALSIWINGVLNKHRTSGSTRTLSDIHIVFASSIEGAVNREIEEPLAIFCLGMTTEYFILKREDRQMGVDKTNT